MSATHFAAIFKKECLLLLRDINGLLLLFAMPIVFIVIMSLAMQQNFAERSEARLDVLVLDLASNSDSASLLRNLESVEAFRFSVEQNPNQQDNLREAVGNDKAAFLITVKPHDDPDGLNSLALDVLVAPATNKQTEVIFVAAMQESLRGLKVENMLADLEDASPGGAESVEEIASVPLSVNYAYDASAREAPTAVQQNVPAWLVFAMFFVVVPLSNTLINERRLGTLQRLRTINVSPGLLILGKLLPYFLVMQLQVVVMLLVGIYLVPLLGGDRLNPADSWWALVLMSVTLSIGALGYGSLIAVVSRTSEQATTLGGAGNIILAALGGIMVPRFVMPQSMQRISELSPMGWGLEGFLDVFLRSGDWLMVWPKALALTLFGLCLMLLALTLLARQQQ